MKRAWKLVLVVLVLLLMPRCGAGQGEDELREGTFEFDPAGCEWLCTEAGSCHNNYRGCVDAQTGPYCLGADEPGGWGHCTAELACCVAVHEKHCEDAAGCDLWGDCHLWEEYGRCAPSSELDCTQNAFCVQHGLACWLCLDQNVCNGPACCTDHPCG